MSFSGRRLTSFAAFVTSSAERVIVYLDKLDEARFNEQNTGVTFVSRGDTIKVGRRKRRVERKKKPKQTNFSYCHMPLLNNQISHPPHNRGCTESHYLLWLRGARQHFSCDVHGAGRRGGGGEELVGDWLQSAVKTEFCLFAHTCPPPPPTNTPYRYVNDPAMNPNAKVYTISFPLDDLHVRPLGG